MKYIHLFDQLLAVVMLLHRDATRTLARLGLTLPRTHVVWLLHHRGPMTQRALADALEVTPRNVTGLVDGLVETGFVTREPHPGDRRAILVSLTGHGRAALAEIDRDHDEAARALLAGMPARFEAFAEGLEHVLERLRANASRSHPSKTAAAPPRYNLAMSTETIVLPPGRGRAYEWGAMRGVFKADGAETGDRYCVSEWSVEPASSGPGAHKHDSNDEIFLVTEGTMWFLAGEEWVEAPAGTFLRIPAGVMHDFENRGAERATAFNVFIPGGFEASLADWSQA